LIGIVGPACAGRKHEIVAGAFAFGADVACRDPRERIEPVQRTGDLRQHVRKAVVTFHVRELVQQHDSQPLSRPVIGVGGHQHRGTEHPPCHRHRSTFAAKEHDAR
jgi:hypothetical protein